MPLINCFACFRGVCYSVPNPVWDCLIYWQSMMFPMKTCRKEGMRCSLNASLPDKHLPKQWAMLMSHPPHLYFCKIESHGLKINFKAWISPLCTCGFENILGFAMQNHFKKRFNGKHPKSKNLQESGVVSPKLVLGCCKVVSFFCRCKVVGCLVRIGKCILLI